MKKKLTSIVFVAAIAVAAAWNLSQSNNTGIELSDIADHASKCNRWGC
jgi:hypothetical protein